MRMAAFAVRKAEGTPYDCLPTLSPAATRRLPGPLTRSMAFEPGSRVFDAFLAASCLSPLRRCAEAAFQASGAERHLLTLVCCDFPEARPSKGRLLSCEDASNASSRSSGAQSSSEIL